MTSPSHPVMLITGGTGSIGREIATQALTAGWAVVIQGSANTSVDAALLHLTTQHPNSQLQGVAADIRVDDAVSRLVEQAAALYGRIDAVVDCLVTGPEHGGITGLLDSTDPGAYLELLEVSVAYLEKLAFVALPWLKSSQGCLVAFSSDAGIYAAAGQALIGAARAATVGFIRNLAAEVARYGVRAHCVSPSFVLETSSARRLEKSAADRLEKARQRAGLGLPTPADIAPLVLFLCGDGARRMTGQIISVNGGLNC